MFHSGVEAKRKDAGENVLAFSFLVHAALLRCCAASKGILLRDWPGPFCVARSAKQNGG